MPDDSLHPEVAIPVFHPAAIYRRWRTFLLCRISAGIRSASQIRQSSFLDLDRLTARCIASPIREQRRASIGRASGFRLVSRAAAYFLTPAANMEFLFKKRDRDFSLLFFPRQSLHCRAELLIFLRQSL